MSFDREHRRNFSRMPLPEERGLNLREALRLGAYGFQRFHNRDMALGFLVALIVHLSVLSFDCSTVDSQVDTTYAESGPVVLDNFGGAGGIPESDAPFGLTPKGKEDGRSTTNADRTGASKSSGGSQTASDPSQGRVVPTRKPPETSTTKGPEDKPTQGSDGNDRTTEGGPAQGRDEGTGTKPAGGIGGISVGDGGLGRCWSNSPSRAAKGAKTSERGKVTVRFTVKWDGRLSNIRNAGGDSRLFSKAAQLLGNVRACPASPDTPPVTVTITYNFKGGS